MICESVNSDQEEKEGDLLNNNRSTNLKNLIRNIDNFLVCKECAQERGQQIKLEEERDVENFIDSVNLIESGPGAFCRWGVGKAFPSHTDDRSFLSDFLSTFCFSWVLCFCWAMSAH